MLYSNREYSLTNKPIGKQFLAKAQSFLCGNEEVLYTFDTDGIIAFFTNKKIIFVAFRTNGICETEILPYHNINRYIILNSPNTKHGKLELVVSDETVISFFIPEYTDAVKVCHTIEG